MTVTVYNVLKWTEPLQSPGRRSPQKWFQWARFFSWIFFDHLCSHGPPSHPKGRSLIHRNPGWGFRSRPYPDAGAALSIGVISCQATVSEPRPRTWIQKVVNKVSVCSAGRRRIYTRCSPHFEGNSRSGRRDESLKRCYHLAGSQDELSFATPRYYMRYLIKRL